MLKSKCGRKLAIFFILRPPGLQHLCQAVRRASDVILAWSERRTCSAPTGSRHPKHELPLILHYPEDALRSSTASAAIRTLPALSAERMGVFGPRLILKSGVEKTLHIRFGSQMDSPACISSRFHPWQMHTRVYTCLTLWRLPVMWLNFHKLIKFSLICSSGMPSWPSVKVNLGVAPGLLTVNGGSVLKRSAGSGASSLPQHPRFSLLNVTLCSTLCRMSSIVPSNKAPLSPIDGQLLFFLLSVVSRSCFSAF